MSSTSEDPKDWQSGRTWTRLFRARRKTPSDEKPVSRHPKWSFGVLNDKEAAHVPGSVLLFASHQKQASALQEERRTSRSSDETGFSPRPTSQRRTSIDRHQDADRGKKTTQDGTIILEPQPEDSGNDPLNWPKWRRNSALLCLGFYCMVAGGITAILTAGFPNVARDMNVDVESVSLTVGLYMMGLGVGSVLASPTAILYGKRPVYLASVILFIATSIWAGYAASFESLLAARVFQGMSISPVECLPSATISEIFFLHERAYRIGIYTLLLLSGKNLVPLVSAAIIGRFSWRWAFFIAAMVAGLGFVLLFLFVPETFWDRSSRNKADRPGFLRRLSSRLSVHVPRHSTQSTSRAHVPDRRHDTSTVARQDVGHVEFLTTTDHARRDSRHGAEDDAARQHNPHKDSMVFDSSARAELAATNEHNNHGAIGSEAVSHHLHFDDENERNHASDLARPDSQAQAYTYTHFLRQQPAKTFTQQLRPYHGRLKNDKWLKVMLRPFILFSYPAVLWSAIVYSCSIGWLIVISETIAIIYRDPTKYNFTALQTGLVYLSPFVGGILGTGVAGKISDIIVRTMSRRNGGLYEPEFRLVMAIPIMMTTCIGLMGFGWSAQIGNHWIVPTVFFGVLSFGCSLGSTTAITYCVDSYHQYAGEALVTLNFSKNIFHGLAFSLFVTHWMADDGPKSMYMWLGIIQIILQLTTIPLFVLGKRARMWTVRMKLMEKF